MDLFEMLAAPSGWVAMAILIVILALGVLSVIALWRNHQRRALIFVAACLGLSVLTFGFVYQHVPHSSALAFLSNIAQVAALFVALLLLINTTGDKSKT